MRQEFCVWLSVTRTINRFNQKNVCTPLFIATLSTIANIWNSPRCTIIEKYIMKMVLYIHNEIIHSYKELCNQAFCCHMFGAGRNHFKLCVTSEGLTQDAITYIQHFYNCVREYNGFQRGCLDHQSMEYKDSVQRDSVI